MARLPLATRAQRLSDRLKGRSVDQLPPSTRSEVDRLARQMGTTPDTFAGWSERTRRRYLAAARRGETVDQVRAADRAKARTRRERKRAVTPPTGVGPEKVLWDRINYLVSELKAEGINVVRGDLTLTDRLDYEDLYSPDSLRDHVEMYGFDYVIARLEHQLRAIQQYNKSGGRNRSIGRAEMMRRFGTTVQKDFRATAYNFSDDDERWFWYHASMKTYYR